MAQRRSHAHTRLGEGSNLTQNSLHQLPDGAFHYTIYNIGVLDWKWFFTSITSGASIISVKSFLNSNSYPLTVYWMEVVKLSPQQYLCNDILMCMPTIKFKCHSLAHFLISSPISTFLIPPQWYINNPPVLKSILLYVSFKKAEKFTNLICTDEQIFKKWIPSCKHHQILPFDYLWGDFLLSFLQILSKNSQHFLEIWWYLILQRLGQGMERVL